MRADHRRLPFSISVDKHAFYPAAFAASQEEKVLPLDCRLRRTKYLNNVTRTRTTAQLEGGGKPVSGGEP